MSIRNLNFLFSPTSIALIGATDRPNSVGQVVMKNILAGGFNGPIMPVNPKRTAVCGVLCYEDVAALPVTPDLAVICTPPQTIPGLIRQLGERGTKAAVVLTAGLADGTDESGVSLEQAMLDAARPNLLRILGYNCVGLILPGLGVNASFAHTTLDPGEIAFVSQSGALTTSILDWAKSRAIGFSHFISMGNSADVDFGDVLDHLANDPKTKSILLYIESIKHARKFMSAARAAARNKSVIVVKAGRAPEGAKAASSHTGALAAADDVFDAAIQRAGMLRVHTIKELYDAVETLARARHPRGDRLAILTNGGGPGVMAADALALGGGHLADLSADTVGRLDAVLPTNWSHGNPIDIIGDAPPGRYRDALSIVAEDPNVDGILVINSPTAIVPSEDVAKTLVNTLNEVQIPVLASWLGGDGLAEAERQFTALGIPTYETPEEAVHAFMQLVRYRKNQALLSEIPKPSGHRSNENLKDVRDVILRTARSDKVTLNEIDAKTVLSAYGIPVVETKVAKTVHDALVLAENIGFPVVAKILSLDISHKSDVGGVALNLQERDSLERALVQMTERIKHTLPNARLDGFTIQKMINMPHSRETLAGAYTDPVFGPVIMFGHGGTAVEVMKDRAVALPPLNTVLAREMVNRTHVSKLLDSYRNVPAANRDALYKCLIQISRLMADNPEVIELDINPLLVNESGVVALDARLSVRAVAEHATDRFAIRPYPAELEEDVKFVADNVRVRPILPTDEPSHSQLFKDLSIEDRSSRFFSGLSEMPHEQLARYTQIDYDREMAFVAIRGDGTPDQETLGVIRTVTDPDNLTAELAIVVRSDLKRQGLGSLLMEKMIRYTYARQTRELIADTKRDNISMLKLAEKHGFSRTPNGDGTFIKLHRKLD